MLDKSEQRIVDDIARVGWQEIGQLRTHLLPIDSRWYAHRLKVPTVVVAAARLVLTTRLPTVGYVVAESTQPDGDIDEVWGAVEPAVRNGVVRDSAWFRWRYAERPGASVYRYFAARLRGSLRGVAVTTVRQQQGADFVYVLELLASDPKAARSLVHSIAADARGAAGVVLATLPNTSTSALAQRAGLRLVPQKYEEKPLHFGVVDNLGTRGDQRAAQWTLGWGDLDHV